MKLPVFLSCVVKKHLSSKFGFGAHMISSLLKNSQDKVSNFSKIHKTKLAARKLGPFPFFEEINSEF